MPRTQEAYEEIRERSTKRILEAASKVMSKRGRAATIAEVAAEAGVSQGLAYRYFPSKEAIFYALVREMMSSGGIAETSTQKISGTSAERLEQIITNTIELRQEHPEFYQFLFQAIYDDKLPKDIREMINSHGLRTRRILRQLIVDGQKSGEIARDDPDQLVDAILACLDGISRRMISTDPARAKMQIPKASIILRMLKPDQKGSNSN